MHQLRKHDTQFITHQRMQIIALIFNTCNFINFSDRLLIFRLLCDISGRI